MQLFQLKKKKKKKKKKKTSKKETTYIVCILCFFSLLHFSENEKSILLILFVSIFSPLHFLKECESRCLISCMSVLFGFFCYLHHTKWLEVLFHFRLSVPPYVRLSVMQTLLPLYLKKLMTDFDASWHNDLEWPMEGSFWNGKKKKKKKLVKGQGHRGKQTL